MSNTSVCHSPRGKVGLNPHATSPSVLLTAIWRLQTAVHVCYDLQQTGLLILYKFCYNRSYHTFTSGMYHQLQNRICSCSAAWSAIRAACLLTLQYKTSLLSLLAPSQQPSSPQYFTEVPEKFSVWQSQSWHAAAPAWVLPFLLAVLVPSQQLARGPPSALCASPGPRCHHHGPFTALVAATTTTMRRP
jgi:hypothetical protein